MPTAYQDAWNGTCSTCATSSTVWDSWSADLGQGTSATTTLIWNNWATSCANTYSSNAVTWGAEANGDRAHAAEAKKRAKEILARHLTEEQRAQLARDQFFVVQGSAGKRYRVKQGRAGNVEMLDDKGQAVERLCAHPAIWCPDEDTMLAQKLAIEADEESYRKIANVTRLVA